jgi:NAD(P)-dependent dehydrogenase (short-subunit alcohol dehydrogenase family)
VLSDNCDERRAKDVTCGFNPSARSTESLVKGGHIVAYDSLNNFRLDGKVSLVTGASRGLGKAIAEALAGAGSDVILTGREMATLRTVATAISEKTSRRILPIEMDVGNVASIQATVEVALKEFGTLDVLVNNAAINSRMPAAEYTEEAWDSVMTVNSKGAFFMAQACGKAMIERRKGKIINILSLTVAFGLPTVVAYTAAKAGLMQLTRLLAVEWAPYNVNVNGIAPGFFRTELTTSVQNDARNNWVLHRTPLGRWGEPEDITGAVLFLASSASDFVTGQVMFVDGGVTAGSDWRSGL